MLKERITYVVMIVSFGICLWVILSVGSHLRAADNVAGEWQLHWSGPAPAQVLPNLMSVRQSGRFLIIDLNRDDKPLATRLRGQLLQSNAETAAQITVRGPDPVWQMTAQLDAPGVMIGRLEGPSPADWTARRPSTKPAAGAVR